MQKHSYYLAKYLAANGIEVDLYHFSDSKEFNAKELEYFSEMEKLKINNIVVLYPHLPKFAGSYVLENYLYSKRIYNILKNRPAVDFIYAKGFAGWHSFMYKKVLKAKIGVNFHGYEMYQPAPTAEVGKKLNFLKPFVKYNISKADCVFSYGGKVTDVVKSIGLSNKPIIELTSGINKTWLVAQPTAMDDKVKFVFVGRNERRKGVEEIKQALKGLTGSFSFEFIGPIPVELHQANNITYAGSIMDEQMMKDKLQQADVMVCPSYAEGMPNVILEGMASGLAVIATDVGAVSMLVDNENGWLVNPKSALDLQNVMQNIINISKDLIFAKKEQSLMKVRHSFTWDAVAQLTIEKINKFVNEPAG